jgi:hypothetical protein
MDDVHPGHRFCLNKEGAPKWCGHPEEDKTTERGKQDVKKLLKGLPAVGLVLAVNARENLFPNFYFFLLTGRRGHVNN